MSGYFVDIPDGGGIMADSVDGEGAVDDGSVHGLPIGLFHRF